MQVRVGVVGASGYSGMELVRLLARHPGVALRFATSDRWVGKPLGAHCDVPPALAQVPFVANGEGLAQAADCDVVFFATPAETSHELVPKLPARCKAIDLAGTFRLADAALYPTFYNLTHGHPALLAEAAYGLPELFRASVPKARVVANPGCYATAAALSLAPLVKRRLVDVEHLTVTAASGVSGAGRKVAEEYGFMEVEGDVRAYKVLSHQHTPEVEQALTRLGGLPARVVFTPHLLPIKRGIISTAVARLAPGATPSAVAAAFADDFGPEPLVPLAAKPEAVRIANVVHTPKCQVGAATDGRHVVVVSALDNLLKGAASQAVQNLNLLAGLPETTGLV